MFSTLAMLFNPLMGQEPREVVERCLCIIVDPVQHFRATARFKAPSGNRPKALEKPIQHRRIGIHQSVSCPGRLLTVP